MIELIYTTKKRKKIKVYFTEMEIAFIKKDDLESLFNISSEELNDTIDKLPYEENVNDKYYTLSYVFYVGEKVNPDETKDLFGWYTRMTEEHPEATSEEFERVIKDMLKESNTNNNND